MTRKLSSWINHFYEYTEALPSPELFREWAAISIIAGALERKVWVRAYGTRDLYPNLYVVLVGPPGVGKTILTSEINALWGELSTHHIASSSVTKASLIDDLRDAERNIVRANGVPSVVSFNSLLIASNELGVFLPSYENDFMNVLTDIYDGNPYSERRRTKDLNFKLSKPQLNLVAATTPSYLNNLMPEGAWEQGFASRTIFVYSGDNVRRPLFAEEQKDVALFKALAADLKHISALFGKITFTEEAARLISEWHMKGGPPSPEHPKLINYLTRRTAHLLKLCMVACVDESDDMIVTPDHYQRALNWLVHAEGYMPDIFKSMRSGGDSRAMEDVWYFAYEIYAKGKQPVPEHKVVRFLQERTPAHNVMRILDTMVKADLFKTDIVKGVGKCYVPQARKAT